MGPHNAKIFVFLLVAVSTSRTEDSQVIPACVDAVGTAHLLGDSYLGPDGCNTCQCLADGSACTRRLCEASALGRSQSDDPDLLPQCEDVDGTKHKLGESYIGPDNCNTCVCLEGGNACSRKFCPPDITSRTAEADKCVDNMGVLHNDTETGRFLHADGCNTCTCLAGGKPGGKPSCTRRLCLKFKDREMKQCVSHDGTEYKVGGSWMHEDECSKCICGVVGPICNSNYCRWDPHNPDRKRQRKEKEQSLGEEDDAVVLNAKHGIVTEDGDVPCEGEDGTEHMPGALWLSGDGCNSCTCPGNGDPICTEEGCRVRLERLLQRDPELEGLEPGMEGSGAPETFSHYVSMVLLAISVFIVTLH